MTLDFIQGRCFGVQRKPNWLSMLSLKSIADIIANSSEKKQFETSLVQDINSSYAYLADLQFRDIDSDTDYVLKFDNNKQKWLIEILNSSEAEVSLEEKNSIIKDETVSEILTKVKEMIFEEAADAYIKYITQKIEEGNLLKVDEAKAEALQDFLQDRDLKSAFEKKTFVK